MKRKQPFTFPEFKTIYSKVPRLCVDLIIKTEEGVLLTLRQKHGWKGQWHLPGSTVYYKESIQKAVIRTAKEELGLNVKIKKLVGFLEFHSEIKERGFGYSVSLVFICEPKNLDLKLDQHTNRAQFFKKIPTPTVREHKEILTKLIKNGFKSILS